MTHPPLFINDDKQNPFPEIELQFNALNDSVPMDGPIEVVRSRPTDRKYFYPVFLSTYDFCQLFGLSYPDVTRFEPPEGVLEDIRAGRAKLLLDLRWEGLNPHRFDFEYTLDMLGLRPTDVWLIHSDYNVGSSDRLPTVYVNYWERWTFGEYESNVARLDSYYAKAFHSIVQKQLRPYKAINLNRILKPHRWKFCKWIDDNNLGDQIDYSFGLSTYNMPYSNTETWYNDVFDMLRIPPEYQTWIRNHGVKHISTEVDKIDLRENQTNIQDLLLQATQNSYFSIVSETYFNDPMGKGTRFLSEKAYKPFMLLHPFVLISTPKNLDHLRQSGYDVFDDLINHSYDDYNDDDRRMEMVQNEVMRLLSIPADEWSDIIIDIFPRLMKNRTHLIQRQQLPLDYSTAMYRGEILEFTNA